MNVLVVSRIGDASKNKIKAVSPHIKLLDTTHLWHAPTKVHEPSEAEDFSSPEFDAALAQAEVLFGFRPPKNVVARAPNLKWIQGMLAGVDYFLDKQLIESPVIVTNSSGIHGTPVGEFAIQFILMMSKNALPFFEYKQQRRWQRIVPDVARGKTVGIVGLGNIGKEIARIAKALGMRVVATRRSARKAGKTRNVDLLLPKGQLPTLLAESDFVVLAVPLTPETRDMLGENELKIMKSSAFLVNIGRGGVLNEEALIKALENKWIAGAGLDTFDTEPLPPTSRLWDIPNLIITPHVSGMMKNYDEVATGLFCKNLERYLSGKKLLNVVDKGKGY